LRRTTESSSRGAIPQMHRSAQDGAWSSRHDGGEGAWCHPIVPRGGRATRGGRGAGDPGRPGIVRTAGMVESMGHLQTKGPGTGNTTLDLEPLGGRRGDKRERHSSRREARSRSGASDSGTTAQHHASDRCREARRCGAQKAQQRGKAPCSAAWGKRWEAVSRDWEGGEVHARKPQHQD
jgi:hypothetical protein